MQDLTEGTGLARGSLYKAFHDKRTLFLAALDHYTAASLQRVGDALSQPGSARGGDPRGADGLRPPRRGAQGQQGCLITAAAMEMMPEDAEVGALISRMFRRMQDLFAAAVIRGQAAGEISARSRRARDRADAALYDPGPARARQNRAERAGHGRSRGHRACARWPEFFRPYSEPIIQ